MKQMAWDQRKFFHDIKFDKRLWSFIQKVLSFGDKFVEKISREACRLNIEKGSF